MPPAIHIHTHVNVSSKAYVYDETIYNFCARARFAGCTFLRNIILALNTVYVPEWEWSVVNMKEVEERFICSTYIYLLPTRMCQSGGGVWSI